MDRVAPLGERLEEQALSRPSIPMVGHVERPGLVTMLGSHGSVLHRNGLGGGTDPLSLAPDKRVADVGVLGMLDNINPEPL